MPGLRIADIVLGDDRGRLIEPAIGQAQERMMGHIIGGNDNILRNHRSSQNHNSVMQAGTVLSSPFCNIPSMKTLCQRARRMTKLWSGTVNVTGRGRDSSAKFAILRGFVERRS